MMAGVGDSFPKAAAVKQAVMLLSFIPVESGQNVSDYQTRVQD